MFTVLYKLQFININYTRPALNIEKYFINDGLRNRRSNFRKIEFLTSRINNCHSQIKFLWF